MKNNSTSIVITSNTREELAKRMQDMVAIGWVLEEYNAETLSARLSMTPNESHAGTRPLPPRRIDG